MIDNTNNGYGFYYDFEDDEYIIDEIDQPCKFNIIINYCNTIIIKPVDLYIKKNTLLFKIKTYFTKLIISKISVIYLLLKNKLNYN